MADINLTLLNLEKYFQIIYELWFPHAQTENLMLTWRMQKKKKNAVSSKWISFCIREAEIVFFSVIDYAVWII